MFQFIDIEIILVRNKQSFRILIGMEEGPSNKSSRATNYSQGDNLQSSRSSNNSAISLQERLQLFDPKLASTIASHPEACQLYKLITEAEKLIRLFQQLVAFMYLETLTGHVQGKQDALQEIFESFQDFSVDWRFAENREQLGKCIKKLQQKCKRQFKYKSTYRQVSGKFRQIEEIMQDEGLYKLILGHCDFKLTSYTKGSNKTRYNHWQTFLQYLKSKKINLGHPLKDQIHQMLMQQSSIIATYNRSKPISGTFLHRQRFIHHFNIPYRVQVPFVGTLPFHYQTRLKGRKRYQGSKYINRCTCRIDNGVFNIAEYFGLTFDTCYFCCRDLIEVRYTGLAEYDIPFEKRGNVGYEKTQVLQLMANFAKAKEETVQVPYKQMVTIRKDFETKCKNHHRCSCEDLAEIAYSAREAYFDIVFYLGLLEFQGRMAQMMNIGKGIVGGMKKTEIKDWRKQFAWPVETPDGQTPTPQGQGEKPTPNEEETPTPGCQNTPNPDSRRNQASIIAQIKLICKKLVQKFNLPSYNILDPSLTLRNLSQLIHKTLSQSSQSTAPFHHTTILSLQQKFNHKIHFQGNEHYQGTLRHQDQVLYSQNYEFHTDLQYRGTMKTLNCHEDCWFCRIKEIEVPYEGTVHLCKKGVAQGIIPFNQTKKWEANVPYSQTVPFNEVARRQIEVDYDDECEVVCEKSQQLGLGHHSCTSCTLWQQFIQAYLGLLQIKEVRKAEISKNQGLLATILSATFEQAHSS